MSGESATSSESVRVEVFLQTHTCPAVVERLRSLVSRARRLEDGGTVDEVRVKTWSPVRPALEELSDSGPSVTLTVNSFQAWADREGYTLRPAFTRRETASLLSRRPAVEIRVPIACLAVYEGDTLRCVVPCTVGERTYSVEECLTALEAGISTPFGEGPRDRPKRTFED